MVRLRRRQSEYNKNMTHSVRHRLPVPDFLDMATYVSMAAMSLLGISGLHSLPSQFLALEGVLNFHRR